MEFYLEPLELRQLIQLFVAAVLGAFIGLQRELAGKDPSLRTFSLICLGSCLFSIVSVEVSKLAEISDPGRIAAQIVTGIGFLGAGAIFRRTDSIAGLTTAALMWVTAAIGMAVGFNYISLGIAATVIAFFVIYSLQAVHRLLKGKEASTDPD